MSPRGSHITSPLVATTTLPLEGFRVIPAAREGCKPIAGRAKQRYRKRRITSDLRLPNFIRRTGQRPRNHAPTEQSVINLVTREPCSVAEFGKETQPTRVGYRWRIVLLGYMHAKTGQQCREATI